MVDIINYTELPWGNSVNAGTGMHTVGSVAHIFNFGTEVIGSVPDLKRYFRFMATIELQR